MLNEVNNQKLLLGTYTLKLQKYEILFHGFLSNENAWAAPNN